MKASLKLCILLMLCGQGFSNTINTQINSIDTIEFQNISQTAVTNNIVQGDNTISFDFIITSIVPATVDSLVFDLGPTVFSEIEKLVLYRGTGTNKTIVQIVDLFNMPSNTQAIPITFGPTLLDEEFSLEVFYGCVAPVGTTYTPEIIDARFLDDTENPITYTEFPFSSSITTVIVEMDPLVVSMIEGNCDEAVYQVPGHWTRLNSYVQFLIGNVSIFLEDFISNLLYFNSDYQALSGIRLYNQQNQLVYESTISSGVISYNNINLLFEAQDTQKYFMEILAEDMGFNNNGFPTDDIQITASVNPGDTYELNCGQAATVVHESPNLTPLQAETYRSLAFATAPVAIKSLRSVVSGGGFEVISSLVTGTNQTFMILESENIVATSVDNNGNSFGSEWKTITTQISTNATINNYQLYDENGFVANATSVSGNTITFANLSLPQNNGEIKYYAILGDVVSTVDGVFSISLDKIQTVLGALANNVPYFESDELRICNSIDYKIEPGSCPADANLNGISQTSATTRVDTSIVSQRVITSSSDIQYVAGECIELKAGFEVELGSSFETVSKYCADNWYSYIFKISQASPIWVRLLHQK